MSNVYVYPKWWWTCDECGESCEYSFDSPDEATEAGNKHVCDSDKEDESALNE